MCFFQQPAIPRAPTVAPEPTRASVAAESAAAGNTLTPSAANQVKQRVRRRLGVFGNVNTTPLGDASYGQNLASFAYGA